MRISCSVDEIRLITPEEVKKILDSDRLGENILVDVRQPEEYARGHIPGSILIPLGDLEARFSELDQKKNIVLYCRSGKRSMGGAILLCGLGFNKIYSMEGGMLKWNSEVLQGKPDEVPRLIKGSEEITDILMLAVRLEKGSQDFYLRSLEKVKDKASKATLRRLAKVEERHMNRLFERYEKIFGKNKLPDFHSLQKLIDSEYMEGGMKTFKALLKIQDRDFEDEMAIFESALEKEFLSYDFYKRSAELMDNPDTRSLLHELAAEERNHVNLLLNEIKRSVKSGDD